MLSYRHHQVCHCILLCRLNVSWLLSDVRRWFMLQWWGCTGEVQEILLAYINRTSFPLAANLLLVSYKFVTVCLLCPEWEWSILICFPSSTIKEDEWYSDVCPHVLKLHIALWLATQIGYCDGTNIDLNGDGNNVLFIGGILFYGIYIKINNIW